MDSLDRLLTTAVPALITEAGTIRHRTGGITRVDTVPVIKADIIRMLEPRTIMAITSNSAQSGLRRVMRSTYATLAFGWGSVDNGTVLAPSVC